MFGSCILTTPNTSFLMAMQVSGFVPSTASNVLLIRANHLFQDYRQTIGPRWVCRRGHEQNGSSNGKHNHRNRASKRTILYDAMKQYYDHFHPLLEAELQAEQAEILSQRKGMDSNPNTPYSIELRHLIVTKKGRLFSNTIYFLHSASRQPLPESNKFSKGDLINIRSERNANGIYAQGVVLSKSRSELRVVVPIGSEASQCMDSFAERRDFLQAECGTNIIAYERAVLALEDLTKKKPGSSDIARLIVMSFTDSIQGDNSPTKLTYSPNQTTSQGSPLRDSRKPIKADLKPGKWDSFSKESVTRAGQPDIIRVMKGLPTTLNGSQREAIKNALKRRLTLIQGPPGTGKTVTAAHLISCASQLQLGPILACAASNVAVDNLMQKIVNAAPRTCKVVRIGRIAAISEDLWSRSLEVLLEKNSVVKSARDKLARGAITLSELQGIEKAAAQALLRKADIVVGTCVGSGHDDLKKLKFPFILIDEASQATEPDVLIPLSTTTEMARQIVLVGDHHQLSPTTLRHSERGNYESGLEESMFFRLWKEGIGCHLLNVQYRMHPQISKFPCKHFYFNRLRDGVSAEDRRLPPWLTRLQESFSFEKRVLYCDVQEGLEEHDVSLYESGAEGTSFFNKVEANVVVKLVDTLVPISKDNLKREKNNLHSRIGVISPYAGQVRLLRRLINGREERGVEVCTVDGFQGREKDVIIFSSVRNNENRRVGFLQDWRRLNVAITRARTLLIVVGHKETLREDKHWGTWLRWVERHGTLISEATLHALEST